ncbi:hypothetical protein J2Z21_001450 [Streptomyces griseochromogenes]|uniref:Uncharacterized protein n=1 Tax=Streptomyces griseochromogenes TaxID=68214 RepID=A0A1B1B7T3_9ACTN|nr:Ig-like domain-containing protein [Streptomyces griseochromogenes]ANP54888.1 hypothetical protein AVL59_39575 [Streptomyces griseochromogenes]MBP2048525.1 hypothetical protein [Streptomyces griseochromogenes]
MTQQPYAPPQPYQYPPQSQPAWYPYPPQSQPYPYPPQQAYPYPPQFQPYPYPPQTNGSTEKEYPQLTAATVKGTVMGQAQAQISAKLIDSDGEPIKGVPITFTVGAGRQIGIGVTDATGVAHLDSGSNLLDPLLWAQAIGSGYEVQFQGNKKYMPALAHGKIEPGIG